MGQWLFQFIPGFLMSSRVDYGFVPQMITEMKQMQEGGFDFEDLIHRDETLARMNTMRKEGQFCDAVLEIDGKSINGHRIVLASSNVFFFEFFSTHEEKSGRKGASTIFKLDEFHLDYSAVQLLVNYFYSGRYLFCILLMPVYVSLRISFLFWRYPYLFGS